MRGDAGGRARAGERMKAFSIGFEDATFDESRYARLVAEQPRRRARRRDAARGATCSTSSISRSTSSTSRWPIRRSCRPSCSRGWPRGTSRWWSAATAATSCGAATRPTARTGYAAIYAHGPRAGSAATGRAARHRHACRSTTATRAWSGSCAGSPSAGTTTRRAPPALDVERRSARSRARRVPAARGAHAGDAARARLPGDDRLACNQILALDFTTYMPGSVLTKVDRASMAHGLEVRPPLLDNAAGRLGLLVCRRSYKLARPQRQVPAQAAPRKGNIPDEVIERPKKGFGIPLAALAARSAARSPRRSWSRTRPSGAPVCWAAPRFRPGIASIRPKRKTTARRFGLSSCWIIGFVESKVERPSPEGQSWSLTRERSADAQHCPADIQRGRSHPRARCPPVGISGLASNDLGSGLRRRRVDRWSVELLKALCRAAPQYRLVSLSRNFWAPIGHHGGARLRARACGGRHGCRSARSARSHRRDAAEVRRGVRHRPCGA